MTKRSNTRNGQFHMYCPSRNGCTKLLLLVVLACIGEEKALISPRPSSTIPSFYVNAFVPVLRKCRRSRPAGYEGVPFQPFVATTSTTNKNGLGVLKEPTPVAEEIESSEAKKESSDSDAGTVVDLAPTEVKSRLLELLPRMTGKAEEFKAVESYVNSLENNYSPVQTLDFLNLAMGGEWQLLFSTNRLGTPNSKLRLREFVQRINTNQLEGNLTNVVLWDLANDGNAFDSSGTFSVKCSYQINQGARMNIDLDDHVLELAKGSKVPKDVQGLVGMLHRAMPTELFDPNEIAMDTTYLDGDLRIVRLTGSRFEGVRNIFIRSGSVEIDPTE